MGGLEALVEGISEADARRRPAHAEWSIQDVVDHLVETNRASVEELAFLLRGQRPPGPPIPAGLQSAAPLATPWDELRRELRDVSRAALALLESARPDLPTTAAAPVVMVININRPDGSEWTHSWVEELDWKAYAFVLRLHVLEHTNQVRTIRSAQGA